MTDAPVLEWPYGVHDVTPKENRDASHAALVEHMDTIDQKHDEAHERLRADVRKLQERVESNYAYFRERVEVIASRAERMNSLLEAQTNAPVNLDRLLFTPKLVATIVISLLSIYGFFLAATGGLKADISDIKAAMAVKQIEDKARADASQAENKARAESQDMRDKAFQNDINELRKQVQLMNLQNDSATKGRK